MYIYIYVYTYIYIYIFNAFVPQTFPKFGSVGQLTLGGGQVARLSTRSITKAFAERSHIQRHCNLLICSHMLAYAST